MNGLDVAIFKAVNNWPESQAAFWVFLSNAPKITSGRIVLFLIFIAFVAYPKTRKAVLFALLSWPIADGLCNLLKKTMQWSRPSWPSVLAQYPEFHVRVEPLDSFGTASSHAANMMAVAVAFLWIYRPAGYFWFIVAILVGVSRIYVGVHWPIEVLLGWFCGALVATGVVKAIESATRAWKSRKEQTPTPESQVEPQ